MMGFCVNPKWADIKSFAQVGSQCSEVGTPAGSGYPIVAITNRSPYHDPNGYLWVIDVPPGQGNDIAVQIYDAGHCRAAYDAGTTDTPAPATTVTTATTATTATTRFETGSPSTRPTSHCWTTPTTR